MMKKTTGIFYLLTNLIAILLIIQTGFADSTKIRGKTMDDSSSMVQKVPESAEKTSETVGVLLHSTPSDITSTNQTTTVKEDLSCIQGAASQLNTPFRISVDGVPMAEDNIRPETDRQRCVDLNLERTDIQIHYDPLSITPALNVWTTPNGVLREKAITFYSYSNYALWLRRAEIRIFLKDQNTQQKPFAIIPIKINESATWMASADAPDECVFLLRVYDEKNRFDETSPKQLTLLTKSKPIGDEEKATREALIGFGENSRRIMNIPVRGGTVTVNGKNIEEDQRIEALGFSVPVDKKGSFAFRQIMPGGPHTVEVSLKNNKGGERIFRRNISIAEKDWFYIGIADLTFGQNSTKGPAELVTGDTTHYDGHEYIDGRGAFYLKGKIKGEYLLTASADTRERPIRDIFSNFDSKDPKYLLRRIDPDKYYPVYGDDSTTVDDAPTQGKFYVRLEKGDSHIMWGNFETRWTGTELTQYSRGLYGANLFLSSDKTTEYGEKRGTLNIFAAQPGTIASREESRGTGGSLFYLRHMDITQGSERLWVEVRDKDSNMVLERRFLAPAEDYDINYIQGRVMLRAPLPATADGSTLVQTSSLNGNPVYLITTYEYTPGFTTLNTLTAGGRGSYWINDYFRFGITGYRQGDEEERQELKGADIMIRYRPGTFLKAEIARSQGPGTGTLSSVTGGFDFNQKTAVDEQASAWRIEGAADFSEIWEGSKGKLSAYWQERERGFSSPGQITDNGEAQSQTGVVLQLPLGDRTTIEAKGDYRDTESQKKTVFEAYVKQELDEEWSISAGGRYDDQNIAVANASPTLSQDGSRTDAIVRIDYKPLADRKEESLNADGKKASLLRKPWDLYGFLQGTVNRTGDRNEYDRAGLGGTWQATDRFRIGSELSTGYGGLGGKISGDYRIDDRSNVYLTYTMEAEQPNATNRGSLGTGVFGSKYRMNDHVGFFGETRFTNGYSSSLTRAFGLDLAPNDRWTYGFTFETGTLNDEVAGDMKRNAFGLSAAYKFEKTKFASAVEYRSDSGSTGDRKTWLVKNSLGYQVDPSWRLLGKLNFSFSDSSLGTFYDGDFVEFVAGAAYRPVTNDKWNSLFKYTYFSNLPSPGQVTSGNTIADYEQRSHVLSADTIYDLFPWLSLGFKYGLRYGELKDTRVNGEWFSSMAHLIVARADFHIVHKWDAVVEGRQLHVSEAKDTRSGILLAVYRHLNKNFKVGVGYNFTDFSDNLTDLSYRSRGLFVNILGAF